jgi:hypothetical protein
MMRRPTSACRGRRSAWFFFAGIVPAPLMPGVMRHGRHGTRERNRDEIIAACSGDGRVSFA